MTRAAFRYLRESIAARRVCFVEYRNGLRMRGTPYNIRMSSYAIATGEARVVHEIAGASNGVRCVKGKRT